MCGIFCIITFTCPQFANQPLHWAVQILICIHVCSSSGKHWLYCFSLNLYVYTVEHYVCRYLFKLLYICWISSEIEFIMSDHTIWVKRNESIANVTFKNKVLIMRCILLPIYFTDCQVEIKIDIDINSYSITYIALVHIVTQD